MVSKSEKDSGRKTPSGSMGTSANAIPVNSFKSLKISDSGDNSQDNSTFALGTAQKFGVQSQMPSGLKSSSGQFGAGFKGSSDLETRPFSFKSFTRDNKSTQESSGVQAYVPPHLRNKPATFSSAFNNSSNLEIRPSLKSLDSKDKSTKGSTGVQLHIPSGLKNSSRQFGGGFKGSSNSETRPFSLKNFACKDRSAQESSGVQSQNPSGLKSSSRQFGGRFNDSSNSESRPFLLKNLTYNSKPNAAFLVKSELVGKFIALPTKEISTENFEWRYLYEPNVSDNVFFDLNEEYDGFDHYSKFWYSSIKQLFEFIMAKTAHGTNLKEAVHGSEFVANRGTLAYFASRRPPVFKQLEENEEPPKLHSLFIFTKFEGVIFINRIFVIVSESKNEAERINQKFYWLHKLTNECSNDDLDFDKFGSSYDMHFGVFKAQVTDSTDRNLSCFISAKVDGQDKNNKFVEIKEQPLNLKQSRHKLKLDWFSEYKSKWWIQASLANVDRFIVGIHGGDGVVKKVKELCMSDMENEKKQWKPKDCIEFLLDTFKEVQALLDSKSEGAILKLETFTNRKETSMTWIGDDERNEYEFLPREFVDRFSPKK